jgi:ferredoxin
MELSTTGVLALAILVMAVFGTFSLTSLLEGEHRAAGVSLALLLVLAVPLFLSAWLPTNLQWVILALAGGLVVVAILLLGLPIGVVARGQDTPQCRVDERDIMFARARLVPGSPQYETYYQMRPENKANDDKTRALPGLLSPAATEANPLVFAATDAGFQYNVVLRDSVDGAVASERVERDPAVMTRFVKDLTSFFGARAVGIAELRDYHLYSHIGRGRGTYGAPVTLNHRYAIAFTVEMDHRIVSSAPAAPVIMESARQYVEAAKVAVQLGNFIRAQGWPARAHIDGNYRVVAPLVARDAGLGEIGRMGLLMTPDLGPRVRLGVVTTDLPLVVNGRTDDTSVLDFCTICQKCAENCPVRAIPTGDREMIDGALRWRINPDICFRYWNVIGTDCARCMAVCPYSYPDHAFHNIMRWMVRRSGAARRAALWMDGLFYGTRPMPKKVPAWVPSASRRHRKTTERRRDQ